MALNPTISKRVSLLIFYVLNGGPLKQPAGEVRLKERLLGCDVGGGILGSALTFSTSGGAGKWTESFWAGVREVNPSLSLK